MRDSTCLSPNWECLLSHPKNGILGKWLRLGIVPKPRGLSASRGGVQLNRDELV